MKPKPKEIKTPCELCKLKPCKAGSHYGCPCPMDKCDVYLDHCEACRRIGRVDKKCRG